jgi:hypothetical protein
MHAVVHALSQHTPCAQKPDWQSPFAVQLAPLVLRPQEPAVQNSPAAHWAWVLHEVKQVSPLHR